MKKNIFIIAIVLIILILTLFVIFFKGKNQIESCINDDKNTITGEVISISNKKLMLKTNDNIEFEVYYDNSSDFKKGQIVKVVYDGLINESLPPQINAICIEVID